MSELESKPNILESGADNTHPNINIFISHPQFDFSDVQNSSSSPVPNIDQIDTMEEIEFVPIAVTDGEVPDPNVIGALEHFKKMEESLQGLIGGFLTIREMYSGLDRRFESLAGSANEIRDAVQQQSGKLELIDARVTNIENCTQSFVTQAELNNTVTELTTQTRYMREALISASQTRAREAAENEQAYRTALVDVKEQLQTLELAQADPKVVLIEPDGSEHSVREIIAGVAREVGIEAEDRAQQKLYYMVGAEVEFQIRYVNDHITNVVDTKLGTVKAEIIKAVSDRLERSESVQPVTDASSTPSSVGLNQSDCELRVPDDNVTRRAVRIATDIAPKQDRVPETHSEASSQSVPPHKVLNDTLNLDPSLLRSMNSAEKDMMRELMECSLEHTKSLLNETLMENKRTVERLSNTIAEERHAYLRDLAEMAKKSKRASAGSGDDGGGGSSSSSSGDESDDSWKRAGKPKPSKKELKRKKRKERERERDSRHRRESLVADIYKKDGSEDDTSSRGSDRPPVHGRDGLEDFMDETDRMSRRIALPDMFTLKPLSGTKLEKLYLRGNPPTFHGVSKFYEELELCQQETREVIKAARYMSSNFRRVLEDLIYQHRNGRFEQQWRTIKRHNNCILFEGQQWLSNKQLFQVIRYSVMPKSIEQVNDILYQSVWPQRSYNFFVDEQNIMRKPKNYLFEYLAYKQNFKDMLDLLRPAEEKGLMPRYVMGKSGHRSLVNIMLDGAPNPKFAKQIMYRGIPEEKRNESLTWDQFHYYYDKALRQWVDDLERSKDALRRYTVSAESRKVKPPIGLEKEEKKPVRDSASTSMFGMDGMPSLEDDSDDEEPWETERRQHGDPEVTGSEHDVGFDTAHEEDIPGDNVPDVMKREEQHLLNEMAAELGEDGWLYALEGKTGRKVCWQFAKTGKCGWEEKNGKCMFSHEPEDIELWKAAKALGKEGIQSAYKNTHVKFGPAKVGSATSPGPHSTPTSRMPYNPPRAQGVATSKSGRMKRE
jgi:hypothetical protein